MLAVQAPTSAAAGRASLAAQRPGAAAARLGLRRIAGQQIAAVKGRKASAAAPAGRCGPATWPVEGQAVAVPWTAALGARVPASSLGTVPKAGDHRPSSAIAATYLRRHIAAG